MSICPQNPLGYAVHGVLIYALKRGHVVPYPGTYLIQLILRGKMTVGSEVQFHGGDQGVVYIAMDAYGIVDEMPLSRIRMQFHLHRPDHESSNTI